MTNFYLLSAQRTCSAQDLVGEVYRGPTKEAAQRLYEANSYADGKDIKESLLRGGGKIVMGGLGKGAEKTIGKFMTSDFGQQILERTSIPMTVKIVARKGEAVEKPMQELVSEGVKLVNTHWGAGQVVAHQIDKAVAPPKKEWIRTQLTTQKREPPPSALKKAMIARPMVKHAAERLVSLPPGY